MNFYDARGGMPVFSFFFLVNQPWPGRLGAVILLLCFTTILAPAQRRFRTAADSLQYDQLRRQIAENVDRDIRSDNDDLHRQAEKLLISNMAGYRRKLFCYYPDLIRTSRPDTITHLALYLLTELPEKVSQCTNLKELEIGGSRITKLPAWIGELKHLEILTISRCNLKKIKFSSVNMHSVKTVSLSYNEFRRIPRGLLTFDSLFELNVSGNRIRTLPRYLNRLPQLTLVNLGYNHIRRNNMRINHSIKGMNLSHNRMTRMPFSLRGFDGLMNLNLSYNALTRIDRIIGGKNLAVVNLYSNRLKHMPDVIIEHKGLANVDLSHNEIVDVPPSIDRMKALTDLSLWGNQVSRLPQEIGRLTNLSTLYMQGNQLYQLPDSLARVPIRRLDVGYNRLTDVPAWVFAKQTIEELYINNTDVTELSSSILEMPNLRILHAFDSPVTRTPAFQQIVSILRDRGVNVKY